MDTLLSLAFENISSSDLSKIRKGLRQIEGILAQICLSAPSTTNTSSTTKRQSSLLQPPSSTPSTTTTPDPTKTTKTLADLPSDPAFLTFFHLQDTFSHNLCTRLLTTLEHLLGHQTTPTTSSLTLSTLTLLHGILLLHPPSRSLFSTESSMNLLLDLLDPSASPAIQVAALAVLSSALLGCPGNARVFDERTDGLVSVASLYKASGTDPFVRSKIEDFLSVWMAPETHTHGGEVSQSEPNTAVRGLSPRKDRAGGLERRASTLNGEGESTLWDVGAGLGTVTRTGVEKKRLLGRLIGNVDEVLDGGGRMGIGLGLVDSVG